MIAGNAPALHAIVSHVLFRGAVSKPAIAPTIAAGTWNFAINRFFAGGSPRFSARRLRSRFTCKSAMAAKKPPRAPESAPRTIAVTSCMRTSILGRE